MIDDRAPYLDDSWLDDDVAPGEDFYRYANGGWLAANPVPAEFPAWGAFFEIHVRNEDLLHRLLEEAAAADEPPDEATAMVGDYVSAGLDTDAIESAGVEALAGLLASIDAIETVDDLPDVLVDLHRVGVAALFDISVMPDFDQTDRYMVYVGQSGLGLPERDYYLRDDEQSQALRTAYVQHVATQLGNLGQADGDAATASEAILDFERYLAESSFTAEQMRDLDLVLNRVERDDIDELMPAFGLRAHLARLGVSPAVVGVDNLRFFPDLDALVADTPVETLRDYLRWHLVRTWASALPAAFEDAAFSFYGRTLGGQQEQRERWQRVLAAASEDIGDQVARLYVEAAFSPEAKARAQEMVDQLVEAMERSIRAAKWMTDETREAALTKASTFNAKIGYPDRWLDYGGLTITPDAHVANRMRAAAFDLRRRLERLDEPVDVDEWEMPAHQVNAYYNPLRNEIVFPAGILQPPMFWPEGDDAGNYGGIGTVIGHEITHGFDDNGSKFDEHGRFRMWWSDADRAEFDRRAADLATQVDEYPLGDDLSVNGRLTLGENIADLGGLAIAHDAWRAAGGQDAPDICGFSPAQRFFLAYASIWRMNYTDEYLHLLLNIDVHAPSPVRVNGPVSNLPAFADAFDVAAEAVLRRPDDERVHIW